MVETSPIIEKPSDPPAFAGRAGSAARQAEEAKYWKAAAFDMYEKAKRALEDEAVQLSTVISSMQPNRDAAAWTKKPRREARVTVKPHEVTGALAASDLASYYHKKVEDDASGKVASAERLLALDSAWQLCKDGCACGKTPCAIAKLRRCDNCGKIQQKVCGRAPCIKWRERLAAAAAPAVAAAAAPAVTVAPVATQ